MRFPLAFGAVWLLVWSAAAQPASLKPVRSPVQFQTSIKQKLFLPGESIEVELSLLNNSGRPLAFSPEDGWLDFSVWNQTKPTGEGTPVTRLKPVVVNQAFTVEHTSVAKTRVDLMPCFEITRPGRYKVTASVLHPSAPAPVLAEPFIIEITPGYKLEEQEFGLRPTDGDAQPEIRKFSLLRLTLTIPSEMRLYVSVTDSAEETIFRQVKIGRVAGNDKPQTQLDRLSNWHVLHQSDARIFTHTIVNPRGEILVRESYEPVGMRPGLKSDENGQVIVINSVRRDRPDDILPMKLTPSSVPAPAFP